MKRLQQMASGLSYLTSQIIVVANGGEYGGSIAYSPEDVYSTQKLFHTIEDKQVTISFFDLKIQVKKRINES